MRKLENARHEAYAQARARGASVRDAYIEAGFKGRRHAWRMNRIAAVKVRIEELTADLPWGGTTDLTPVISLLGKAAERAVALNTAASLVAAKGLLVEVAKLKMLLAAKVERAPPPFMLKPRLSDDAWVEKHAPRG
jgi:hypothetical protein